MNRVQQQLRAFFSRLLKPVFITLLISSSFMGQVSAFEYRESDARKVLSLFYSDGLIRSMKADAASIVRHFGGLNVFSSSQYGDVLITGKTDVADIFDARIPENLKILKEYAKDYCLVQNVSDLEYYQRYALAANRFLKEYRYDAVLFYPDEFNPVFTITRDTWMYLREEPIEKPEGSAYYFSGRVRERRLSVEGGIAMEQCASRGFHYFYVPVPGSSYIPFKLIDSEVIAGSSKPDYLNPYKPPYVDEKILKMREEAGIKPCRLSGRKNLKVATWGHRHDKQYQVGFRFSGNEKIYTWGDWGLYVLPLDLDFHRLP